MVFVGFPYISQRWEGLVLQVFGLLTWQNGNWCKIQDIAHYDIIKLPHLWVMNKQIDWEPKLKSDVGYRSVVKLRSIHLLVHFVPINLSFLFWWTDIYYFWARIVLSIYKIEKDNTGPNHRHIGGTHSAIFPHVLFTCCMCRILKIKCFSLLGYFYFAFIKAPFISALNGYLPLISPNPSSRRQKYTQQSSLYSTVIPIPGHYEGVMPYYHTLEKRKVS